MFETFHICLTDQVNCILNVNLYSLFLHKNNLSQIAAKLTGTVTDGQTVKMVYSFSTKHRMLSVGCIIPNAGPSS